MMTLPDFALLNSGCFLLFGMVTGARKHQHMLRSSEYQAPVHVDIAHRAGLMYSFAALVIWQLSVASPLPAGLVWKGVLAPVAFFWIATGTYLSWHYQSYPEPVLSKKLPDHLWHVSAHLL